MPLGLEDARVLAGEQHHRGPQRDRLEHPRRDHVHHHVALVGRQHVAVHVVVRRGRVLLLVYADAPLDRAVEVGDRRAALGAQCRPAGAHELGPAAAVDAGALAPVDVAAQAVVLRAGGHALRDPRLLLAEAADPVRQRAPAVDDVERAVGERRHWLRAGVERDVAGERVDLLDAGKHGARPHRLDLALGHEREQDGDPELADHRPELMDPAVVVLDHLHLQPVEPAQLGPERRRQVAVVDRRPGCSGRRPRRTRPGRARRCVRSARGLYVTTSCRDSVVSASMCSRIVLA